MFVLLLLKINIVALPATKGDPVTLAQSIARELFVDAKVAIEPTVASPAPELETV